MIIDECPGVALDHFEAPLLDHHLKVMTELVNRDKNHPSVVMWSVGNEPKSYRNASGDIRITLAPCIVKHNISGEYFKSVADHTRQLDNTRPVTLVCNAQWDQVRHELEKTHYLSPFFSKGPRESTLRHYRLQSLLRLVQ